MKKLLVLALLATSLFAHNHKEMKNFRAVSMSDATLLQEGKEKKFCPVCGMTLPMFYKTNHAAEHNGKNKQYCSIVCSVEDAVVNKKKLINHKVVDNVTLKFMDSKDAFFVVGSKKPGTMSILSKYAFSTKSDAINFKNKFGGNIMNFTELYKQVEKTLEKDLAATKKRQAKAIKKGKMIYSKMCTKTQKNFTSVAQAKSYLIQSQICGKVKGKKLQALGLYLYNR